MNVDFVVLIFSRKEPSVLIKLLLPSLVRLGSICNK